MIVNKTLSFKALFSSSGCICLTNGNILLLKRNSGKSYPYKWGIPTGKIIEGESPAQAMTRELFEETQILVSAENLNYIDSYYIANDDMNFIYNLFSLELSDVPDIIINKREHTEYAWVKFSDLDKYELLPDVQDTIRRGIGLPSKEYQLNLFTGKPDFIESDIIMEKLGIYQSIHYDEPKSAKIWFTTFGAPGTGKTTALTELCELNQSISVYYPDTLSNGNLRSLLNKLFLENNRNYFFTFQMSILPFRYNYSAVIEDNTITDETIYNTLAYSLALLRLRWIDRYMFDSFLDNYCVYHNLLSLPSKIFYFSCSIDELLRRIKSRQRQHKSKRRHELMYSEQYMMTLSESFEEVAMFLNKTIGCEVIHIETTNKSSRDIASLICENLNAN